MCGINQTCAPCIWWVDCNVCYLVIIAKYRKAIPSRENINFFHAHRCIHRRSWEEKKATRSLDNLRSTIGERVTAMRGKRGGGSGHCVGHNAKGTNAICRVTADSQSIRCGIRHNRCMCERMHDDCAGLRV